MRRHRGSVYTLVMVAFLVLFLENATIEASSLTELPFRVMR
jgi:hypothetical protein